MKFDWNKKYTTIAGYCLGVIVIAILFVVFVFKFDSFAKGFSWMGTVAAPIICGICIAYVLNPLMAWLEDKVFGKIKTNIPEGQSFGVKILCKTPLKAKFENRPVDMEKRAKKRRALARVLALILTYVIVIVVIVGLCIAVLPSVAESVMDLADKMPQYIEQLNAWLTKTFEDNPEIAKVLSAEFGNIYDVVNTIVAEIKPLAGDLFGNIGTGIFNFISTVFSALKNVLLGLLIAIYFLYSKERMLAQVKKIFFAFFKNQRCKKIFTAASKANNIFKKYIISNLLDAVIIFIFMVIGMNLMDMPYAMLVSVICGVTNLIPFFGPFLGAIPSGLLILLVDPVKVLWFAIFVLAIQQADGNIIKPLLFGETMGLPAIWVLISIIVGGGMFGIAGMLLGAPVFAVFYLLFAEFVSAKLEKKDLPTETEEYILPVDKFADEYIEVPPENKIEDI